MKINEDMKIQHYQDEDEVIRRRIVMKKKEDISIKEIPPVSTKLKCVTLTPPSSALSQIRRRRHRVVNQSKSNSTSSNSILKYFSRQRVSGVSGDIEDGEEPTIKLAERETNLSKKFYPSDNGPDNGTF